MKEVMREQRGANKLTYTRHQAGLPLNGCSAPCVCTSHSADPLISIGHDPPPLCLEQMCVSSPDQDQPPPPNADWTNPHRGLVKSRTWVVVSGNLQ